MDLLNHLAFIKPEHDLLTAIQGHYDPWLVLLSLLIATLSSYTAFLISSRIVLTDGRKRSLAWTIIGALSLGSGVWSMHFIGMLAYTLPITSSYDITTTVASVIPAVLASLIVLHANNESYQNHWLLLRQSILMGGGIGMMHYIGMAAMRMDGIMRYDTGLFVLSIVLAIVLAGISLMIKQWALTSTDAQRIFSSRLLFTSVIMGCAISAMHYTGMAAMYIFPGEHTHNNTAEWSAYKLVEIITFVTVSISVLLITSLIIIHRYKLYQRIKESENRQRVILETVADGIVTIKKNGIIETFNPAAEKMFGYQAVEVIGREASLLLPKERQGEHETHTKNSTLTSSRIISQHLDLKGRRKDGSIFPLEINIAPMVILGEEGYVGILRDITERIETQKIANRNHQIQTVLDNILRVALEPISLEEVLQKSIELIINSSVISSQPAGVIFIANEDKHELNMVAQKGLDPSLLVQCSQITYGTCLCGKAAEYQQIQFASHLDERHKITHEGIQPHGHYCIPILLQSKLLGVLNIYLEEGHQPSEDEDEFLNMLTNTLAGIIDRRKTEKDLARFKTTLDHTMDCVFMFDPNNLKFSYANVGAMKQVGYDYDELISRTPYDLQPNYEEKDFREMIKPMIAGDQPVLSFETLHQHKDGHAVPVEILLQYISPQGESPRFVAIVRDISERKRIDEMKNEFISTVSHELRTPLTSIRGALGLISGGAVGELPTQASEMLRIASNNTERLLLLINDILDIQKIESGMMNFKFQRVELVPFIEKAIRENTAYADQYNVTFKLVERLPGVTLFADPDRLMQVMSNLMSNAAKFSPDGDTVELHLARHHDAIRIAVTDHGPGIPEEFQGQLFEKFSQADSTDTRKTGGSGLGLPITKVLIEKHGGRVEFLSRQGIGTTFFIDLPELTSELDTVINDVPERILDEHCACILIIEDDLDIAVLLRRTLAEAGFNSDIAHNTHQARHLLNERAGQYKLITLDLVLPGEDGIHFLEQLRRTDETRKLPVVVISVKADEEKRRLDGGAVGVVDWLQKPIDQPRLIDAINRAARTNNKPRVLHVEDEIDVHKIVSAILKNHCELSWASTLSAAMESLAEDSFDLVLLDIGLPDGSGLDLLETIEHCPTPPQVVIFSASYVAEEYADKVSAVLMKSKTDNGKLLKIIADVINNEKRRLTN